MVIKKRGRPKKHGDTPKIRISVELKKYIDLNKRPKESYSSALKRLLRGGKRVKK